MTKLNFDAINVDDKTPQSHQGLETISSAALSAASGGDAGGDYTNQLHKDWNDVVSRFNQSNDDINKRGDWGAGVKDAVRGDINVLKMGGDALKPIGTAAKGIWDAMTAK